MKKYILALYVGAAFIAFGPMDIACAKNSATAGKTTAENRAGNQLVLSSNSNQAGLLQPNMVALSQMISQAPNQPGVARELLSRAKMDTNTMNALLGKLENDIRARDALLMTLLSDPEFVNMVMQTYAQKFPKTAATLAANADVATAK